MKINEIFYSISGESIQSGRPAIFIRTFGCSCRCSYCDSMYAVEGNDFRDMSVDNILEEINQYDCKYVILTGGEPLIQPDAFQLIMELIANKYHIEIETSGAVDISKVAGLGRVTITMDWKCPSSNMTDKMIEDNLRLLSSTDVLKFVVGSTEDLFTMKVLSKATQAQVFVSPVFGSIEPKDIVQYILDNNLDVRFQLQLHKFVWPADVRGV